MKKIKISFSREVAETLGLESAVILELFNQNLLDNYKQYKGGLSMGMSSDYKIALDYGATIIRVGSKIFK